MPSIVLDPGHGGSQPAGASTPFGAAIGGVKEKVVNLAIAREVARVLGGRAVMTRDDDVNVDLRTRRDAVQRHRAQAFVSIHSGGAAPGEADVFVHERAGAADLGLARALAGAMTRFTGRRGDVFQAPLAVLDAGGGAPRCLVEIGQDLVTDRAGRLDRDRVDALSRTLARGLEEFLEPRGRPAYGRRTARISGGEYGLEIDNFLSFKVSDDAEETTLVQLLKRSAIAVSLIARIDARVIGASVDTTNGTAAGALYANLGSQDFDADARCTATGPHLGKLLVQLASFVEAGNRFIPGGASDAPWTCNFVSVQDPPRPTTSFPARVATADERGGFLDGLIDESHHLDALIQSRFPRPGTLAGDLTAFLNEEIFVRQQTQAAMAQIMIGPPAALRGFTPATPPTVRRDVERDFRDGTEIMTYLESFVLERLIGDQTTASALTRTDLDDLVKRANAETLPSVETQLEQWIQGDPGVFLFFDRLATDLPRVLILLLRRRALSAHWKLWRDGGTRTQTKEQVLQAHAAAIFPSGVYSP